MLEDQLSKYKVNEILSSDILKVPPDMHLSKVIDKILEENILDALIVENDYDADKLLGIITLSDISRLKKQGKTMNLPVALCMTRNVLTITSDKLISEAREILINNHISRLPIYENQKILGIIRMDNILNSYYRKLQTINKQYMNIIDNMHEAVTVTDHLGHVLLWNKNAENIYGIKAKEILYKKLEDYFPNALSLSVLEQKIPIENIYHSPKPDYHVIISALPIYVDGNFLGVVATERDVTEYRKLSTKLENANSQINLLKEEVERFSKDFFSLGHIHGKNSIIQNKIQIAKNVSKTNASVLITGESGTGKEVFARAIHKRSGRKGPFVPVNCSAIPENLFESEFFGYVGGAFTGALKNGKIGYYELADHGTLFLDEIGDLPLVLQGKLLRILQEGSVLRIGSGRSMLVDVRIISATNKNLGDMIKQGLFRKDLFYRLNVVNISLPPLRERREDIILLFEGFLKEICAKNKIRIPPIDKEVYNILLRYDWQGNIRELKNTVEYILVLSGNEKISIDSVPPYILEKLTISTSSKKLEKTSEGLENNLKDMELRMIRKALEGANGNKSKAAVLLNIPRTTLYYKLKRYKML
ncbi:PAS domain S-box-containing protein [Anaerovirgula multivorans]|uniref:PAS domain S-box-containing protein n=1 Tax=Anaerovirgula multivorans TaxID=312168 RepID=A0A239GB78_9FIRM|nr:sigma-54-dependent Fis family transcriptional regulator [Anaerovirgula multivorans]SNS66175.1 PAS domain S-box-containing protein [Anaerovirgula multivorans]